MSSECVDAASFCYPFSHLVAFEEVLELLYDEWLVQVNIRQNYEHRVDGVFLLLLQQLELGSVADGAEYVCCLETQRVDRIAPHLVRRHAHPHACEHTVDHFPLHQDYAVLSHEPVASNVSQI